MHSEAQPLITTQEIEIPKAPWTLALPSSRSPGRRIPQNIAHRGFRARYPENTMVGFIGARDAGAHALETDLHLTSEGEVVLSHDATGKRCFGVDKKISECSLEYLSSWRTLREPHEPLPKLAELLEWLTFPENRHLWLFLDIKVDDPAVKMIEAIARVIAQVKPVGKPWEDRIVLGCWNASFLYASRNILPTFPVAHTSFNILYSEHFFSIPNLGFNILYKSLIGPFGWIFFKQVQHCDRQLLVWTVNEEYWMRWCLRKNAARLWGLTSKRGRAERNDSTTSGYKLIDGVITDDPELFGKVCRRWEDEMDGKVAEERIGFRKRINLYVSHLIWCIWGQVFSFGLLLLVFWRGRLDLRRRNDGLHRRSNGNTKMPS